ncbi:imidazole glycerol phosphate synthase subunit HisH [Brackiella oedipodis]|uniref:imidazole glycerol phosphate synthase subunit HisH n=1 Tax=Brackiella oedipodis TaxID=124225 RepID=UPI0004917C4B|nr:imidazole glycerol phosphate synthase subunit HisH [Brackiella oedipodis]
MSKVKHLAVVDYGMGNLHSVARALQAAVPEAQVQLATTAAQIAQADRLVLPGQGAMRDCMANLQKHALQQAVLESLDSKPVLGVCVGFQMLFNRSEEGDSACLGLLPGVVRKFAGPAFSHAKEAISLKVPHMGWNRVKHTHTHVLWRGIPDEDYFYFVHSYYADTAGPHVVGQTLYGHEFCSAIAKDNVFAVQFHPEKSGRAGLQLLQNFVEWHI